MVNLTTADISDSAGAQAILDGIRKRWPWVKHLFADGAYDRLKLMDKAAYLDFVIEIIRRSDDQKGFEVLPRRWVVERTFGWMTRWRRLVRDYEAAHRRLARHDPRRHGWQSCSEETPIREFQNDLLEPASGDDPTSRGHVRPTLAECRAGTDRRSRRGSRLALCRIFHCQHPQPEHATRLLPSVQSVFRVVRRSWFDAGGDLAARRRYLHRAAAGRGFRAVG